MLEKFAFVNTKLRLISSSREYKLERFSIKFRKTRTKEITTANQKKVKYL